MSVIDFHTHVLPTAAQARALQVRYGYADSPRVGTPEELLPLMESVGESRALIVPWMPAQDEVDQRLADAPQRSRESVRQEVVRAWFSLNQWAVDTVARHPDRLSCLVGLDPILMTEAEIRAEVADKLAKGACGLKIAPLFIRAKPSDGRMTIVFELAAQFGVFVLSQAGKGGYADQPGWGHPRFFEEVLRAWPQVDIQLAHLGLGAEAEVAALTDRYPNLYADTSARLHEIGQPGGWKLDEASEWFRRIGTDRVVFGTNYPMHDPKQFIQVIARMPLSEEERERVLCGNAEGILERAGRGGS